MTATTSSESPLSVLQAIADELADCVDRLDAAGLGVEASHVDHGRALVAAHVMRRLERAEADRLRAAAAALFRAG